MESNKGPVIIYQLGGGGGGGAGQCFGKPVISSATPPPCQIFISQSTPPPQQQTVYNADPTPNGPSPLLSQQIITLEIPNWLSKCY